MTPPRQKKQLTPPGIGISKDRLPSSANKLKASRFPICKNGTTAPDIPVVIKRSQDCQGERFIPKTGTFKTHGHLRKKNNIFWSNYPSIRPQSQRHIEMLTLASAEPTIAALRGKGEPLNIRFQIRILEFANRSDQNVHQWFITKISLQHHQTSLRNYRKHHWHSAETSPTQH